MTRFTNCRLFAIALLATAFTATAAHAQYSVLYNFGASGGVDAAYPIGTIAQGEDGALYSTAQIGGANDWGAVYKVTTTGTEHYLYSFCAQAECADGDSPVSGLTLRPDGHFLGTTPLSDGYNGPGTIFDVSQTGGFSSLYTFSNSTNGALPQTPPILGPDGNFYGVASEGGSIAGCGVIYRFNGSTLTVVHNFNGPQGCNPTGLVLGSDGNFYGTTQAGGSAKTGVAFQFTIRTGKAPIFTVLTNFASTNGAPVGSLVEGNDGNYYGVTGTSGKAAGSVFQLTTGGVLNTLHVLNGTSDGAYPTAGLTFATDGNFYGTASAGGAGVGTLFQATSAGGFNVLYTFLGQNSGWGPGATVQHTNGVLYGVTNYGGAYEGLGYDCGYNQNDGCGVLYSWNGGLPAFVSTVQLMGAVGSTVEILGQGFTASTAVSFNGTAATTIKVQSGEALVATVPPGATTGSITVTTSTGTLTSNRQFIVTP
jgi:uncharacterized repeat protein (TIGR03803 family)